MGQIFSSFAYEEIKFWRGRNLPKVTHLVKAETQSIERLNILFKILDIYYAVVFLDSAGS